MIEPIRRYAIGVFDLHSGVYREMASARRNASRDVLTGMAHSVVSDLLGIDWKSTSGENVNRTDRQLGGEGSKISVEIAGDDLDEQCLYSQLVVEAVRDRQRRTLKRNIPADQNITQFYPELRDYVGLNARHSLAVAIQPYLERRIEHWQAEYAQRLPTDLGNSSENRSHNSEPTIGVSHKQAQPPKSSRGAKTPVRRRNRRYLAIDEALRQIEESKPKTHEEIFRLLDQRRVRIPFAEPFQEAGGWMAGFRRNKKAARPWLSKRRNMLDFDPLPMGPKNSKK